MGKTPTRDAEGRETRRGRGTTSTTTATLGRVTATTTTTTMRGKDVVRAGAGGEQRGVMGVGSFSLRKGSDAGAGAGAGASTSSGTASNGDGAFSMDQLKAAMDRGVEHFSSEVEKAISAKKISFAQNFPLGRGARDEDGFERAGGRDGDTASHRADRKKALTISTITEMARRASQDSGLGAHRQ